MSDRDARCPYCGDRYAASVLAWHMDRCQPRAHNCRFEYCTAPTGKCPNPE